MPGVEWFSSPYYKTHGSRAETTVNRDQMKRMQATHNRNNSDRKGPPLRQENERISDHYHEKPILQFAIILSADQMQST
jgi:hypothetical protein